MSTSSNAELLALARRRLTDLRARLEFLESHQAVLVSNLARKSAYLSSCGVEEDEEDEEVDVEEVDPDVELGMELEQMGDWSNALEAYERAYERSPENLTTIAALFSFFVRVKLEDLSLADPSALATRVRGLHDALRRDALDRVPKERAIYLWKVLGEDDEALEAFKSALAMQQDDADTLYNYANFVSMHLETSEEEDLEEEAVLAYRRALEINPEMVPALNNLGALLVERSRDMRANPNERTETLLEAAGLFERAQALVPGAPGYNLACVAAQLGQSEKCKAALEQAVNMMGLSAEDLLQDEDLDPVKKQAWFLSLTRRLNTTKR